MMVKKIENHTEKIWWIARSIDGAIVRKGFTDVSSITETGQDIIEPFTNKDDWVDRLIELGQDINNIEYY